MEWPKYEGYKSGIRRSACKVSLDNFQTDKLLLPSLLQNCPARYEMIIERIQGVLEQSILILTDSALCRLRVLSFNLNKIISYNLNKIEENPFTEYRIN